MVKKIGRKRYIVFSLADLGDALFTINSEHDELGDAQSACKIIHEYCGIFDREKKKIVELKER